MVARAEIALAFRSVSKVYAGTRALVDLDLEIKAGTVHALIGENGAGKSTCLSIASGRIAPTAGTVEVFGAPAPLGRPRRLRQAGVASIYQELTIAGNLTPSQNVFLGEFPSRGGLLDRSAMRSRYAELAEEFGVSVQPEIPAGQLSVAEQQVLEILRALALDARVILFDEPTASLAMAERVALLALIRRLRDQGVTIVFVSHNLDEVLDISDQITVFRNGRKIRSYARGEATKNDLVADMLGQGRTAELVEGIMEGDTHRPRRTATGDEVLAVADLQLPGKLASMSLSIRAGEVLGIGGLVGSGRTELLRCLAGMEPSSRGTMRVKGQSVKWPRSVRQGRQAGVVLIPEDRKGQGIVPRISAAENIGLGRLHAVCRNWLVWPKNLRRATAEPARRFGFSPDRLASSAGSLSGGNQQKLLLARAYSAGPLVLLADEPTRGIDVGAKAEIMDSLRDLASRGCAVVVVSSELEVVVAISDRVIVLHEGVMVAELDGVNSPISEASILGAAFALDPSTHGASS